MSHDQSTTTPARLGYRMPAEWESHRAVWLAWPHNKSHFGKLEAVQEEMLALVLLLHEYELVHLLVQDLATRNAVQAMLEARGCVMRRVYLETVPHADVWLRDTGPTFLVKNQAGQEASVPVELGGVDWLFDGWGGKFPDVAVDDILGEWILAQAEAHRFRPFMYNEGGNVETNGVDTVLSVDSCLVNKRNDHLNRRLTETYLREYTSANQVLWLPGVLTNDDTDGHVDNVARFVTVDTVVAASAPAEHPDFPALAMNHTLLANGRTVDGRPFQIVDLPLPDEPVTYRKHRLPASYCNFYIGNGVVVVPQFAQPESDQRALEILRPLFPGRKVVGLPSKAILTGGGSLHCLTQQQPGR